MSIETTPDTTVVDEVLEPFMPITIENVSRARQALIDADLVFTHKMAQEVILDPILKDKQE